ncbi:MAG: hypothetical protein GF409_07635 [Candidatus Omnitrophica bacterium]|nr:hypothetical protein [Candidatus Omnitrophota bacterium]
MKIDSYSFGNMSVNGKTYENDLIVYPDKVEPEWWREEGHSLSAKDLEGVIGYGPDYLVVGRGASSNMAIPDETSKAIEDKGIELLSGGTEEMYEVFNRHMKEGKKTVGAFHLTC